MDGSDRLGYDYSNCGCCSGYLQSVQNCGSRNPPRMALNRTGNRSQKIKSTLIHPNNQQNHHSRNKIPRDGRSWSNNKTPKSIGRPSPTDYSLRLIEDHYRKPLILAIWSVGSDRGQSGDDLGR